MNVSRIKLVGMALVIFAVTVWLYWPSVHGGFLTRMDDAEYLQHSVQLKGLTWNAVKWAFTEREPYYHPLPRLSHVLDYQIWRKNAAGHHATGVFLHALNAALVFGFLWTLLGAVSLSTGERLMVALWVAMVFAIHPLQTESVAWMSGRTQLLCTTFGIGSLWAYAAGSRRWLVWGLFVAAVLSKPMAVSLPFVMLAMDYYPLRRHERLGWKRLFWEKAVMIVVAGVVGVATTITVSRGTVPWETVLLSQRVLLMCQSLTFYLWKLVWPVDLSPTYPLHQGLSLEQWPVLASVLSVGMITALAVWGRSRLPWLTAAWGAYLAFVLPVSGLIQTRGMATRYAYVAVLPPLLLVGGAGVWIWRRSTMAARGVLVGLLGCELCLFAVGTRGLIPDWHDDETLQRAILAKFPDSEFDIRALAQTLLDQGRASEALEYAQRDVEIAPERSYSHMTLGRALGRLGRSQEAIAQDEQALRMNSDSAQAHCNFGAALMDLGKVPEAVEHFEQALRINPNDADAHYNLGIALAQIGKIEEAIAHFEQVLRINPDDAEAHYNLGLALQQTGRVREAIAHYEQALRIKPDYPDAHNNLGAALYQTGKPEEAMEHYRQVLRIKPDDVGAHNNLGIALAQTGKIEEAIAHYEQALRIKPDFAEAHNNLGFALAQTGKIKDAIAHYEQALRIKPDLAEVHCYLGNALAQVGRVPEAILQYEQALRIKPDLTQAQNALARLQARQ
jgi:tetratricopeptide (TPR) repeat protein